MCVRVHCAHIASTGLFHFASLTVTSVNSMFIDNGYKGCFFFKCTYACTNACVCLYVALCVCVCVCLCACLCVCVVYMRDYVAAVEAGNCCTKCCTKCSLSAMSSAMSLTENCLNANSSKVFRTQQYHKQVASSSNTISKSLLVVKKFTTSSKEVRTQPYYCSPLFYNGFTTFVQRTTAAGTSVELKY
jgi:hypothetical protein